MFDIIRANQRRAVLLVVVMAALLFAVGYAIGEIMTPGGGSVGLFGAFVVWVILTIISYYNGSDILLSVSRARRIEKEDHPVLFNVVEEMSIASGLGKMPDIYLIDDPSPNAFATGRDPEHAAVTVTSGLLEIMDRDELQGVIAHELGHVKNRDVLYMTMVGVMMGAIVLLADLGARRLFWGGLPRSRRSSSGDGNVQLIIMLVAIFLIILAPVIAQLIYLAVSRRREYLADASSALFTRYPEGLASALEKLGHSTQKLKVANRATAALYIVNPLKVTASGLSDLTSTHPPLSERIRILRNMAGTAGLKGYDEAFRKVTGRPVGVVPLSAMNERPHAEVRGAAPGEHGRVDRARLATDALWKLDRYSFITCACGTRLKVPPTLAGKVIDCPHCGAAHSVPGPSGKQGAPTQTA